MSTEHRAGDLRHVRERPVLAVDSNDGALVVRLGGELDLYNAPIVRQALADAAETKPGRLVVDLSEVSFIDSTALGVLIEARTKLKNRSALLLAAPRVETRRALHVSGLDRHLPVHESVEDALAASL